MSPREAILNGFLLRRCALRLGVSLDRLVKAAGEGAALADLDNQDPAGAAHNRSIEGFDPEAEEQDDGRS